MVCEAPTYGPLVILIFLQLDFWSTSEEVEVFRDKINIFSALAITKGPRIFKIR